MRAIPATNPEPRSPREARSAGTGRLHGLTAHLGRSIRIDRGEGGRRRGDVGGSINSRPADGDRARHGDRHLTARPEGARVDAHRWDRTRRGVDEHRRTDLLRGRDRPLPGVRSCAAAWAADSAALCTVARPSTPRPRNRITSAKPDRGRSQECGAERVGRSPISNRSRRMSGARAVSPDRRSDRHGTVISSIGTAAVTSNSDDVPRMMPGADALTVTTTIPSAWLTADIDVAQGRCRRPGSRSPMPARRRATPDRRPAPRCRGR